VALRAARNAAVVEAGWLPGSRAVTDRALTGIMVGRAAGLVAALAVWRAAKHGMVHPLQRFPGSRIMAS